jgi:predicted DNA binding protein
MTAKAYRSSRSHPEWMTLYEVEFRLVHGCPYTAFSRELPAVVVHHWCSKESDVLEFSLPAGTDARKFDDALNRLEHSLNAKVVRKARPSPGLCLVVQKHEYSAMKQNVNAVIEDHNCMEVQPTVYRGGYEWYRVLAFSQSDLIRLFGALSKKADIDVVSRKTLSDRSVRDTLTISSRTLFGSLTDKQLSALLAALSYGYYNTPRRVRTSDISRKMDSPRTTFETHLRKAEGKVLRALLPYIELNAGAARARPSETLS